MQTNKTLVEKYGQLGFQSDMEGFVKLFNNTYIRKIFIKVYNGDDVLVSYTKKNLIAECASGFNQEKRLVLEEIKTRDNRSTLMDIAVDNISECISNHRGNIVEYLFTYKGLTYSFDIATFSERFIPRTLNNEFGQVVASITTQDLLKYWDNPEYKEMTQKELYDLFTVEGVHLSTINIWVTDHYFKDGKYIRQNSTLLKNKIKNVYLRHEINEDGSENIVIHKGKAKGNGGYDSDFIITVSCDKISGCVYGELPCSICENPQSSKRESVKIIHFAFDNIICTLEYNREVK